MFVHVVQPLLGDVRGAQSPCCHAFAVHQRLLNAWSMPSGYVRRFQRECFPGPIVCAVHRHLFKSLLFFFFPPQMSSSPPPEVVASASLCPTNNDCVLCATRDTSPSDLLTHRCAKRTTPRLEALNLWQGVPSTIIPVRGR